MKNGLYIAQFGTALDEASGVIVINYDTVMGGDSGMYYSGSIRRRDDRVEVEMTVHRHNPVSQSVFGDFDAFTLKLSGKAKGESYQFEGRADAAPSLSFRATLTPVAD
ncbi:MAG: GrlR family regulatory protein [Pseudomonadota bacterium]